jgi:peptidoglycan/xylan/chitin deacetylase (PgdA/CDA1 family)
MSASITSLALHNPALARIVDLLEAVDERRPDLLRVLTYHRVVEKDEDTSFSPGIAVSLPVFQQHAAYLSRHYHVLHIKDLLKASQSGTGLPPRSVLITFDDAYQDFARLAWPVLRRHDLPVTLFVPTAFPDHPERVFWWDWLSQAFHLTKRRDTLETPYGSFPLSDPSQRRSAYKRVRDTIKSLPNTQVYDAVEQVCCLLDVPPAGAPILGWNDLRELARQGVCLGAHTQTHPLMNQISLEEARQEISGSFSDLLRETGSTLPVFAYPGGELNDATARLLQEAGVELGFTTRRGLNDLRSMDRLRISRINIGQRTSLSVLRAQLLARSRAFYR